MEQKVFSVNGKDFKVRKAEKTDKEGLRFLWDTCFEDTVEFKDFFFEKRFFPDYSVCIEHKGKIVSGMHSMPLSLIIRERTIPSTIIAGVGTLPDFRSLGLMKALFSFYMYYLNELGISAVTYKPEKIQTYASLSHYPVTRTLRYENPKAFPGIIASPLRNVLISKACSGEDENISSNSFTQGLINEISSSSKKKCFDLYCKLAPKFSGIVKRSESDFDLKTQDYASVSGKYLIYSEDGIAKAYCFYFETEKSIHAEEIMAKSECSLVKIMDRLHEAANGKKLSAKISSDFFDIPESSFPDPDKVSLKPQNVMGVSNLSDFIKSLDLQRYADRVFLEKAVFEISDPVIRENNAKFNLSGNISNAAPFVSCDIGSFIQFLCGYSSVSDLVLESKKPFEIHNPEIAKRIDESITYTDCYIVDEY